MERDRGTERHRERETGRFIDKDLKRLGEVETDLLQPRDRARDNRHRPRIRGTGQTQKGSPPRETPGCPV